MAKAVGRAPSHGSEESKGAAVMKTRGWRDAAVRPAAGGAKRYVPAATFATAAVMAAMLAARRSAFLR